MSQPESQIVHEDLLTVLGAVYFLKLSYNNINYYNWCYYCFTQGKIIIRGRLIITVVQLTVIKLLV